MTPTHRVLIVDDDARVRIALAGLIESVPDLMVAAAISVADREFAIVQAVGHVAAAIVDVQLPEAHVGLALITALSQHTPVVAVSVADSVHSIALEAGAFAFCAKDGNGEELVAAVRRAIESRRN